MCIAGPHGEVILTLVELKDARSANLTPLNPLKMHHILSRT